MKGKFVKIAAVVAAVVLLLLLVLPLLINAESFRPLIQSRLSAALGRQVQIGKLRFSLLAGGVAAEEIAIADDPAFATQPFVTAKVLDIHVDLWPLLLHKELHINSLTVEQPHVTLIRVGERWNASSLGATSSPAIPPTPAGQPAPVQSAPAQPVSAQSGPAAAGPSTLELKKLTLTGGELTIREAGQNQVFSGLEITASDVTATGAFPFSLKATLPGDGKLTLTGKVGPLPAGDMMELPVEAELKVEHLDLAAYTAEGAGLGGSAELHTTMRSDGRVAYVEGTGSLGKFVLAKGGRPSPEPVGLTFAADYNLKTQAGNLKAADVRFGKSGVKLAGRFQQTGNVTRLNMKLLAQGIQAEDMEHVLRSEAIVLPGGASLQSGTTGADLAISGPTNALDVNGPLQVRNLTIKNFDMGSRMKGIAELVSFNTGPNTVLQSLDTKLSMTPKVIKLNDFSAAIQGMGSVTGAGTVTGQKDLDFHLVAHLNASGGLLGGLAKMAKVNPLGNVPFRVEGTTSNPKFSPDLGAMVHSQSATSSGQDQMKSLGNALGSFFKKKK